MSDNAADKQPTEWKFGKGSRTASKRTKGERTKKRLKAAARKALAKHGYHGARIQDVTAAANVSIGTFYLYFENKRAITMEVMEEFLAEGARQIFGSRTRDDPFSEILEPTVAYIGAGFQNAGLIRALLQFSHDDPEASQLWSDWTHQWHLRVSRLMDKRMGEGVTNAATRTLVVYAMNWMVDGVLQSLLAREDSYLREAVESPEQLAEMLSVLWYRAVYGENPDSEQLDGTNPVLAFHLARAQRTQGA